MNVNALPTEILQKIFINLCGVDVLNCRGICERWQFAVDALGDEFWRKICKDDFSYVPQDEYREGYEEAYRKANLSWRELYITLRLWPKVKTADFEVHKITKRNVINFQIIGDGIIGYPCNVNNSSPNAYDTIIYYNLTTMQEHHRTSYDSPFMDYAENNKLILVKSVDNIIAHIKVNNKQYYFKKHDDMKFLWALLESEFYYQSLGKLYCVKLVQQNNVTCLDCIEITADTININWRFGEEILNIEEIARINSEQVHIRVENRKLFSIAKNKMKKINFFHNDLSLETVKDYGFKWRPCDISNHMELQDFIAFPPKECSDFTTDIEAAFIFDKIVIIATGAPQCKLLIYYDPYSLNRELALHDSTPDISVDLDAFGIGHAQSEPSVTQIDVVEAVNGHNIILLCCRMVYVINLNHNGKKSKTIDLPKSQESKPLSECTIA